jgi:pyrimidine operon attenuation protein/uracil phosphoribosyltransferase
MVILNNKQINQKIRRISTQILEENFGEKELFLVGLNNKGFSFGKKLLDEIAKNSPKIKVHLLRISLNPAAPNNEKIHLSEPEGVLNNQVVILVDDVANTGRTIFYAFKPILQSLPKKIEVAVLVDRKHKVFPIQVNYYGVSLATTLKDNIEVILEEDKSFAYLE